VLEYPECKLGGYQFLENYGSIKPPNQLIEWSLCDRRMTEDRRPDKNPIWSSSLFRPRSSVLGHERSEYFRCNSGAISVEKMETVDSMDVPESTPSREKTEKPPINTVFSHPIHFEVRQPALSAVEGLYPLSYGCVICIITADRGMVKFLLGEGDWGK